jgi:hypothetical protein
MRSPIVRKLTDGKDHLEAPAALIRLALTKLDALMEKFLKALGVTADD